MRGGRVLFREERVLEIAVDAPTGSWSLRWRSQLRNVSGESLSLGNPHSQGGLAGSHYSGLQFRGVRELLDDHLDPTIKIVAEGGLEGVKAVHGVPTTDFTWFAGCAWEFLHCAGCGVHLGWRYTGGAVAEFFEEKYDYAAPLNSNAAPSNSKARTISQPPLCNDFPDSPKFYLAPNSAVPTRTCVAPSITAVS